MSTRLARRRARAFLIMGTVFALVTSGFAEPEKKAVVAVPPEPWSFEDGLPAGVRAEGGRVEISDADSQDGQYALAWTYEPGGTLILPTGPLGNINVWTGYGGYSRSACQLRIRTIAAPGSLTCRFMAGEVSGGRFEIPLVVDGWQRVAYHLSYRSKLQDRNPEALAATDRLVIEAPAEGEGGTIYIDLVSFNVPLDFRRKREAIRERWEPVDPHTLPDAADLLYAPSADELAALAYFQAQDRELYEGAPASAADVAAFERQARDTFGLRWRDDGRAAGTGIEKSRPLAGLMKKVAVAWLHTDDAAIKAQLESLFFLANDFLRQQGAVPQGAIGDLNWYNGREHGDACYIMREPLRRTGRLETVRNCLKYNWGYRNIYKTDNAATNMDYFYITLRFRFKIALMEETPAAQVIALRAFQRRFSRELVDTIKPDGSLYHHGFHYFAYASGASHAIVRQMRLLAPTPFAVSEEAYDAVKLAFINMRWYANARDLPLTLHGRHPGRQQLSPEAFVALAEAGRAYYGGQLDPDAAAAALRLDPTLTGKPPLLGVDLQPEPAPQGHVTMPFAGLTSQRRGEWLAMVRGYGRYLNSHESYANTNRHGLFFANGYLDILGGGDPVTIGDSGCRANDGWDWRFLDGTTTIDMPYSLLANGNGTGGERSAVTFVGGLTHDGRNGLFAQPIRSSTQYRKSLPEGVDASEGALFTANKSYFFFENRIICLGSDIALPDSPFPVHTTLFQKFLPTGDDGELPATWIDGDHLPDREASAALDRDRAHLLIDTQQTGYYLPLGQDIRIVRGPQTSRDGHDKKDTTGDYERAWIGHGVQPDAASYHYAIIVGTTANDLATLARGMEQAEKAPYVVFQQDDRAHVVRDRASRTWGAVFWQSMELDAPWEASLPRGFLRAISFRRSRMDRFAVAAVDRPCLIMQEYVDRDTILLSVADPDLKLKDGVSQPSTMNVTLHGSWDSAALPPDVAVADVAAEQTRLTVTSRNGDSVTVRLTRRR